MRVSRQFFSLSLLTLVGLGFVYLLLYNAHSSWTSARPQRAHGLQRFREGNNKAAVGTGKSQQPLGSPEEQALEEAPGNVGEQPSGHRTEAERQTGKNQSSGVLNASALEELKNSVPDWTEVVAAKVEPRGGKEFKVKGTDRGVGEAGVTEGEEKGKKERKATVKVMPRVPRVQTQTSDGWPVFSKEMFPGPIPPSPFHPNFTIRWDFNTMAFLQRPDVKGQPPKLITWKVKTRYTPPLPEPVRLRVCPEMPCLLTTNLTYSQNSSALLWAAQIMTERQPPARSHPDQVYVFHNHEPQEPGWIHSPSFRLPAWKSAFNWTMHYRMDSDIVDLYGALVKRARPTVHKNYTNIVAKKTKLAAWLVSHCGTHGKREKYVDLLRKHMPVDVYGGCSKLKCPRNADDSCFKMISSEYKFFFAFENAFCKDYISEKFFRYLETDAVVVARGSNEYKNHAPPGIFINTADFKSTKDLADYLLHLDSHPEEYIQILKAKDQYQPLYEDWPIRHKTGSIHYMHYHYEAVAYCELCRRLWDLDQHRKTIPDISRWFDAANCYPPRDLV